MVVVTKRHRKRKCLAEACVVFLLLCGIANVKAQTSQQTSQRPVVSVLDLGSTAVARTAAGTLRTRLSSSGEVVVADPDLSRAAAKGIGYEGSLNLTTTEARDLGAALAVEFYIIGDAQTRSAALHKEEKLELLHRYLSGVEFRQRVEAVVEAFNAMRHDLDQERRAAERQWARRARQIDAVTLNVAGMYGDLQGILPALPSIRLLELPAPDVEGPA